MHAILTKSWKEQRSSSLRSVPFVLVEDGNWPNSGYVHVSWMVIFGNGYPVALLDEEKFFQLERRSLQLAFAEHVKELLRSDHLQSFHVFCKNLVWK